jgi:ethanolamine utilization protein EutA (predicted chaperonin)
VSLDEEAGSVMLELGLVALVLMAVSTVLKLDAGGGTCSVLLLDGGEKIELCCSVVLALMSDVEEEGKSESSDMAMGLSQ